LAKPIRRPILGEAKGASKSGAHNVGAGRIERQRKRQFKPRKAIVHAKQKFNIAILHSEKRGDRAIA